MKKSFTFSFLLTFFISFMFISCAPLDLGENFIIINTSYIEQIDGINAVNGLSSDGSKLYLSFTKYYDVENKIIQDNISAFEALAPGARQSLSLSRMDMFMTAGDISNNFIFDFMQKSYNKFDFLCKSWSNNNNNCIDINGNLIKVSNNEKIENWDNNIDFNEVENISGNGDYLWDDNLNLPIAVIKPCPTSEDITKKIIDTSCKLITPSLDFNQQTEGIEKNIINIDLPNTVIDWTFDPSGRFILLAIWERESANDVLENFTSDKNVIDTRLVIVDWKTGETFDLIKLSEIIPNYPVSLFYGNMQWSSDGSTIFVPLSSEMGFVIIRISYLN